MYDPALLSALAELKIVRHDSAFRPKLDTAEGTTRDQDLSGAAASREAILLARALEQEPALAASELLQVPSIKKMKLCSPRGRCSL